MISRRNIEDILDSDDELPSKLSLIVIILYYRTVFFFHLKEILF